MSEWDKRHNVPIKTWKSIDEVRIEGPSRHAVTPLGEEEFQLDALVLPRESDTLIVAFHGAIKRDQYEIPRFEWFSTLRGRSENLMFVADPTLTVSDSLILSWYTGTAHDDVTARFAALIRSVAAQRNVKNIVLFGFSGGGFAALAAASHLPGSSAVVFSPQVAIDAYYRTIVEEYVTSVFPQFKTIEEAKMQYSDRLSLLSRYREGEENPRFWYIQNDGDQHHVRHHYGPFFQLASDRPGAHFMLVHDGDSHVVPPKERVHWALDECLSTVKGSTRV